MKKPAPTKNLPKKKSGHGPPVVSSQAASIEADRGPAVPSSGAEALPDKEEIASLQAEVRAFLQSPRHERVRTFLERLRFSPPQVLLLEGGTADERLAAVHYWALLLNCPAVIGNLDPAWPNRPIYIESSPRPSPDCRAASAPDVQADAAATQVSSSRGDPQAQEQSGLLSLLAEPPKNNHTGETPLTVSLSLGLPGLVMPVPPPSHHPEQAALSSAGGMVSPIGDSGSQEETAPSAKRPHDTEAGGGTLPGVASSESDTTAEPHPCLECPECIRMLTHLHRDCFFLDGLAGSIKIDEVRSIRAVLGEPPREARRRIVIFREAQSLVEAAANALLKSFEEPRPGTSFVLLAPQRERLLPTLVSRSVVLTLPWPFGDSSDQRDRLAPWEASLCMFLQSGRDFLERSGAKGAVDAPLVHDLTNLCRRALTRCLTAQQCGTVPGESLESLLARMPLQRLRMLDEALAECQDSLMYNVNPTLVLEWLATRMYLLLPRATAGPR